MRRHDNRIYEFADFRLEMNEGVLRRDDKNVPLRPKLFDLLVFLIEHRGSILEKDEITSAVWRGVSQGSPDQPTANLTVNISSLRQVLGDAADNPMFIETVGRRGYRFIALVRVIETSPPRRPDEAFLSMASATGGGGHAAFLPTAESFQTKGAASRNDWASDGRMDSHYSTPPDQALPENQSGDHAAASPASRLKAAVYGMRKQTLIAASVILLASAAFLIWLGAKSARGRLPEGRAPSAVERASGVAPRIDSIEPATPLAWIGDKPIRVHGGGFHQGLTVIMVFPSGGSASLGGDQVLNVTPEAFTLIADFNNNPGAYRIRVNNPAGVHSNWLTFDVFPMSLLPEIAEVKQSGIANGSQRVTVVGRNFLQSVSAVLIYPDGQIEYPPALRVSAESFYVVFDPRGQTGPFRLQAQNAGRGSNAVSFSVSIP